jgi:tetratricopeptide (TPR) repeat protein
LILTNQYKEAIELYIKIEAISPERYSTASNIGTAYELIGENEKALKWINKSVEIDPTSHHNSEWIHAKILEAKIKGESFITTSFLLNTDFGSENLPSSSLSNEELQKLSLALYYQLNERVSFVKPKEKIVAQLLFDLGNIAFKIGNYSGALRDYAEAKKYGFEGKLIESRINEVKVHSKLPKIISKGLVKNEVRPNYFIYCLVFILISILLLFLYRKTRKTKD